MANEAVISGVANKLGGAPPVASTGKQYLLTNEHGVESVITEEHLARMQYDAKQSKHFADKMKTYKIVEFIEDEPQEEAAKPAGKGKGKKSEPGEPQE